MLPDECMPPHRLASRCISGNVRSNPGFPPIDYSARYRHNDCRRAKDHVVRTIMPADVGTQLQGDSSNSTAHRICGHADAVGAAAFFSQDPDGCATMRMRIGGPCRSVRHEHDTTGPYPRIFNAMEAIE